jgi:hypothetical protein
MVKEMEEKCCYRGGRSCPQCEREGWVCVPMDYKVADAYIMYNGSKNEDSEQARERIPRYKEGLIKRLEKHPTILKE